MDLGEFNKCIMKVIDVKQVYDNEKIDGTNRIVVNA